MTRKIKTNFVNNIISNLCRAIELVEIIFLTSHIKLSNVNNCCSNDSKWPVAVARYNQAQPEVTLGVKIVFDCWFTWLITLCLIASLRYILLYFWYKKRTSALNIIFHCHSNRIRNFLFHNLVILRNFTQLDYCIIQHFTLYYGN